MAGVYGELNQGPYDALATAVPTAATKTAGAVAETQNAAVLRWRPAGPVGTGAETINASAGNGCSAPAEVKRFCL